MNKFRFQLFSDIHIELRNGFPKIRPLCTHLLLAGDIGNMSKDGHHHLFQFLDYCSQHWEKVYYVPGNHEFYIPDSNFTDINRMYKETIAKRYTNVYYLDNDGVQLTEHINLYGCTFWTRPNMTTKYDSFTDYMYLTKSTIRALSMDHEQQLKTYLETTTKKTIVMTHFPPIQNHTSHPRFANQPQENTDYFAWNSSVLGTIKWDNVLCWISGHTHYSYDFTDSTKNHIRFLSNQMGYSREMMDESNTFNEDGLYEI